MANATGAPPATVPAPQSGWRRWLGLAALLCAALVVLAALLVPRLRRRRHSRPSDHEIWLTDPVGDAPSTDAGPAAQPAELKNEPATPPEPALFRPAGSPTPSPPVDAEAPVIALHFRARRAGMNLTGAAVDYALELQNRSAEPVTDVRVDIRLLTASEQQDEAITALFAAPVEHPAVAPFNLPGGAKIDLNGVAMLPRDALTVLTMRERRFFVPIVAIRAVYRRPDDSEAEVTSVQVIGIDRGVDAKMAPFRVDVPPRMYDTVTQREHVPKR